MKVPILITALALDEEDVELTRICYNSFMDCPTTFIKDITVDPYLHGKDLALTAKWNEFLARWRNKEYDYLMLCANDTVAHPDALEWMVRVMEDNKDVGILHPVMNREPGEFLASIQKAQLGDESWKYTSEIFFSPHETANMILRRGVVETVGEFDLLFPHERNEQDYFVRAKRAGIKLATSPMKLFYHPKHSQDDPNRQGLSVADKNFLEKWGADWFSAVEGGGFSHPFNNPDLPITYTKQ